MPYSFINRDDACAFAIPDDVSDEIARLIALRAFHLHQMFNFRLVPDFPEALLVLVSL